MKHPEDDPNLNSELPLPLPNLSCRCFSLNQHGPTPSPPEQGSPVWGCPRWSRYIPIKGWSLLKGGKSLRDGDILA